MDQKRKRGTSRWKQTPIKNLTLKSEDPLLAVIGTPITDIPFQKQNKEKEEASRAQKQRELEYSNRKGKIKIK